MGYGVGDRGKPLAERRKILAKAFEKPLTKLPDASNRNEWGEATSERRLIKTVHTLRNLCDNARGKNTRSLRQAIEDYESDLRWLHDTYYKQGHFNFFWPTQRL